MLRWPRDRSSGVELERIIGMNGLAGDSGDAQVL
jgi:hypothetical protein